MTESQNKMILEHLKKGNGISTWQAVRMFNCLRLSGRIKNLRDAGHEIYAKTVEHGGKHFALYYMENSPHFESFGVSYVGKRN